MTESPTAVTCPATNPAAGAPSAAGGVGGVVVTVVVVGEAWWPWVWSPWSWWWEAWCGVVASGVAVVVVPATVVPLVECNGGVLWAATCRLGVAAQPAAMIPAAPAASAIRIRLPRSIVRVTGPLWSSWPSDAVPGVKGRRSEALAWAAAVRPLPAVSDSERSAGFGGVAQLEERRLCKP